MSAPWWFCNGWWSPWCVVDTFIHEVLGIQIADHRAPSLLTCICDRHEAEQVKAFEKVQAALPYTFVIPDEPTNAANGYAIRVDWTNNTNGWIRP